MPDEAGVLSSNGETIDLKSANASFCMYSTSYLSFPRLNMYMCHCALLRMYPY